MLDKISWLHLSDFHFRAQGDNFSQVVSCDALARDIPTRLSSVAPPVPNGPTRSGKLLRAKLPSSNPT